MLSFARARIHLTFFCPPFCKNSCIRSNRPLGSLKFRILAPLFRCVNVKVQSSTISFLFLAASLAGVAACSHDPGERLYGTWKGKTKIDQDITITIRQDSTIAIETEADSVRRVQKGTYQIIDRRLRISLTSVDTYEGDSVSTRLKSDHDEAVFTLTAANELVLRRGEMAIILEKVGEPP